MGDPAGVGPEIVLKVLRDLSPRAAAGELDLVVIGTASCMADAAARLGLQVSFTDEPARWPQAELIEAAATEATLAPGELSAEAGRLAFAAIERAIRLAQAGAILEVSYLPI
jgi:4-hydroxythreonine-4-phosphate dehydrogenase